MLASLLGLLVLTSLGIAQAQDSSAAATRPGRLAVGAGIGLQGDTADGTAFAFNLNGDYYLTKNVAIGPLAQFGFTSDLTQFGLTAQVKYLLDLPQSPRLKPHAEAGIGFLVSDLHRRGTDSGYLLPLGLGVEYRLSPKVTLDTTLFFNFTDVHDNTFFVSWIAGAKIPF